MEKGWVKLHRRILENDFLMHDNNAYLVFTKLLLMVGKEKGQWAGGRRQLGELMNLNHSTLYKVLIRLEDAKIITIESKVRYSVISINNWQQYQQKEEPLSNRLKATPRTLVEQGSIDEVVTDKIDVGEPHGNHTGTTRGHSNKNKKENKNIDIELLELLNSKTERTFRTLPKGYKETLKTFSLEEIGQALDNMKADKWHGPRMKELKSTYLLRSSTIDDMLNRKPTNSQADWLQQIKEASNAS